VNRFHKTLTLVMFTGMALLAITPVYAQDTENADLAAIKTYLMTTAAELKTNTEALVEASQAYYDLAEAADFDYEALWADDAEAVTAAFTAARESWIAASPLYEQIEGVVAGVPVLSEYDVILDAGVSVEEDPENAADFSITLPDGTVMEKPGNIFGLLEGTLWGTRTEFNSGVWADLDENGDQDFAETLPDANYLLGMAQSLDSHVSELIDSGEAWEPNETDAFTALVVMVPTMSEYFGAWKESRFVLGEDSTQTDFVVISRLADIEDILGGLVVIYDSVSPSIASVDAAASEQIRVDLVDLLTYVSDLYVQEQDGRVFMPEEADFFGSEAQDRAQSIAGQIAQVAALLNIELPE